MSLMDASAVAAAFALMWQSQFCTCVRRHFQPSLLTRKSKLGDESNDSYLVRLLVSVALPTLLAPASAFGSYET